MKGSQKDSQEFTKLPNAFFTLAAKMREAELRVTLAIARETFGWHRSEVELSLSDLMRLTGLTRQGVSNGLTEGLKRETIRRIAKGQGFEYSICIAQLVNEVDQSTVLTSQPSGLEVVNEVDQSSQRSRPVLVNEVDQPIKEERKFKETIKEKGKKAHRPRARKPAKPKEPTPLPEDFSLTEEMRVWAEGLCDQYGVDVDLEIETENFKDYCRSGKGEYVDYKAGWRTRIRHCVTKLWGTARKRNQPTLNGLSASGAATAAKMNNIAKELGIR
jgi:phage replication O-like protein O